ncbi:uncharacterized protein LOC130719828 [Lotus japonicus]|uniref:uncharacterized protein LOC130719828 n=1 Tax=Lotus japonicus TaxID=34305 RepID=UPI0025860953|nr:uncharacterized protein LOC130719828 [Lotus japonicus]
MAMSSDEAYCENEKQLKERRGKRETYNLNRHVRDKIQERLDFKFYDFQALEIEKGWNMLFVSIISIETGETIAKSGKASVQNGQCHWEDSMLTTIWVSDDSLQDKETCLLKLVVAMGSPKFGTLGEATINLASYIRPETSTASLPLQHCSHGAILQVKIQCLTSRRKHRKDSNSYVEEMSVGYDDVDSISDVSDNTFGRTGGSSSHCDQLEYTYYQGELISKRRLPLSTCSDYDVDSLESSFPSWIEKFSQQNNVNEWKAKMNERQDSTYSKNGPYDTSRSIYSSSTPATSSLGTHHQENMDDLRKVSRASDTASTRSAGSSKDVLAAAQVTMELLHGEVKMWEENARNLMIDVEGLRKELKKKSKNKRDLEIELSASRKENDELKEEIQRLATVVKQNDSRNLKFQMEEMDNIIKGLKDEIKNQKGLNYNLVLKLKKTQESNVDLISILRKSEKIREKQKMEIERHGIEDSDEEDFSLSMEVLPEKMRKELCHSDFDICNNANAIRCLHEGIELQEFGNLELERRLMKQKQKNMECTIHFLERTLDEKEKHIISFEKKLSDGVNVFSDEILALTQRVLESKASLEYEINSHAELVRSYDELQNSSQELRKLHAKLESEFTPLRKDSKTLVNKDDVRNLSELESSDNEQNTLFGLEAENMRLSERIFILEAEMRHLNEEKELSHLALENSENAVINLQAEIRRMESTNEEQKVDLKRMEESKQKKWIEAQENSSFLKEANFKLQATNEKLVKESKTLQATNGELRVQILELRSRCTSLESKLGGSQIAFSGMLKQVEDLEYKFSSKLEEMALEEKAINVDLDALTQENKEQYGRFIIQERLLSQMYMEKTAEVGNLQGKIEELKDQISAMCDSHKRLASSIVLEVYDLCADNAMLEAALQEEQEKVKLYEAQLDNLRAEYEVKEQNYSEELAAVREKQDILMVNHEQVVVLLEKAKTNEEKLESIVRGLEADLKASELGRLQATEEISELEVQLQKTEMLQDELFVHKRSIYEAELEYRTLEGSYQMLSSEYEELKAKQMSYIQRISTTEKVTSELEECKRCEFEFKKKILQLEWDIKVKEASCVNNAQLRYEVAQMTRENGELHRKKDALQQECEECQKKVKALEEKLKQKDAEQDQYIAKDCSTSTAQNDLKLFHEEDNRRSIKSS